MIGVNTKQPEAHGIDSYINGFGGVITERLGILRDLVREAVPDAVESMSYGLVGYKLNGKPLVYFGGFPKHVGFYATPNGHAAFVKEFAPYKQGKGSVQFPHDKPLPMKLIASVIDYRKTQIS